MSYLYKFFHHMKGTNAASAPPLGVSQSTERPATKGDQNVTWATATAEQAPIGEAMPKLTSKIQCAGEQKFSNDIPEPKDCLYAAYVTIQRANGTFKDADTSAAKKMPGFFGIITAEDIPGSNAVELTGSQKLLIPKGEASQYAGQPCLIVLADSTRHAENIAKAVKVKVGAPSEPPLLSAAACRKKMEADPSADAIEAGGDACNIKRGDVAKALASASKTVKGEIFCDGQKAFYMEPPSSLAIPGEDGTVSVWACAQVPSWTHSILSGCLGIPKNKIVANIAHVGGGFGGKLFKSMHTACACGIVALKYKRACRFHINRNQDTVMCAGRLPMTAEYEVAFDNNGKLEAVKLKNYADRGWPDACTGFSTMVSVQNMEQIYGIPNLDLSVDICKTFKSGNTAIRGPGEPQSGFFMESILDHVALELGKPAHEVREANIFTSAADAEKVAANPTSPDVDKYSALLAQGDKDCAGRTLHGMPGVGLWQMLKKKSDFVGKVKAVDEFNNTHKWRKRGVAMTPVKYAVGTRNQNALVCLYNDGTVYITLDGSEIGQGLHTKVCQYAAYHLSQIVPGGKVEVTDIRVGPNGTDKIAVGSLTGGSTTSEGACEAVRMAIGKLAENLRPKIEAMKKDGAELTYKSLLAAAGDGVELQASGQCDVSALKTGKGDYHIYGAAVSEVEVDVLTGETVILSTSIMYDCGKSLNPSIDMGQCEGAFMMGVGFFLRERLLMDSETGKLDTDGTWEYKIPCFQDVPLEFDVEFFPRAFTEGPNVVSSKASGEPPIVLATSVFSAVKQAIAAGRKEFGNRTGNFRLDAPATPRDIALLIGASSQEKALKAF